MVDNDRFSNSGNPVKLATGSPVHSSKSFSGFNDYRASSSGPLAISVFHPFSVRNTIVTWNFLRSDPNAMIWLKIATPILARDLCAWRINLVTTEHLSLCNQFLAHVILLPC